MMSKESLSVPFADELLTQEANRTTLLKKRETKDTMGARACLL